MLQINIFFMTLLCWQLALGGVLEKLRPDGFEIEGQSFWKAYAKKDLDKRLSTVKNSKVAKNVIFFLGDGMGLNSVTAARIYKGQLAGRSGEEEELAWDLFPFSGLSKTYNIDFQVPDSAGTATGIFSGVKTRLSVIGIDGIPAYDSCDPALIKEHSLKTMLDWSQEAGKDTGIVTTARITHASPAALYAKTANRQWEVPSMIPADKQACEDIAKQMIYNDAASQANVLFGGGLGNFLLEEDGGKRDDEDLVEAYKSQKKDTSFKVLYNNKNLADWDKSSEFALGLFSKSHLPYNVDRDQSDVGTPSLSDMATAAIDRLSQNPNGFFLMVEGARIDQGHHHTDAHRALDEAVQMELAVRAAVNNPNINLDETLIIVTADHSHSWGLSGYPKRGNPILGYVYDEKRGFYVKYEDGTKQAYSAITYANGDGYFDHHTDNADIPWKDLRNVDFEDEHYLNPAMMPAPKNHETHGGEDVATYGIGPMSHLLVGVHEENYLGHVMAYAACIGDYKDDCNKDGRSP